jgi:hypothetical protein
MSRRTRAGVVLCAALGTYLLNRALLTLLDMAEEADTARKSHNARIALLEAERNAQQQAKLAETSEQALET